MIYRYRMDRFDWKIIIINVIDNYVIQQQQQWPMAKDQLPIHVSTIQINFVVIFVPMPMCKQSYCMGEPLKFRLIENYM